MKYRFRTVSVCPTERRVRARDYLPLVIVVQEDDELHVDRYVTCGWQRVANVETTMAPVQQSADRMVWVIRGTVRVSGRHASGVSVEDFAFAVIFHGRECGWGVHRVPVTEAWSALTPEQIRDRIQRSHRDDIEA